MKKLLSIVLSVIILVASLPVSTFASDGLVNQNLQAPESDKNNTAIETQTVDVTLPNLNTTATTSTTTSGTTGDCTWTLDGTVLTISGNGAMGYYYDSAAPWGTSITSVIIEDGVTSIGSVAFDGCSSLTSVTIPSSVKSIGDSAFRDCNSLVTPTIPSSVKSIGDSAFRDCDNIVNLTIPSSVKSIGDGAFYSCDSLIKATLQEGVEIIYASAFSYCDSLISIKIPSSVTSIGSGAFSHCTSLTSVYISDIAAWCNIDYSDNYYDYYYSNPLYYANKLYVNNELVKDIVIPEGVTSIPYRAFSCKNIESITIPSSVTSIGDDAFSYCTSLTSVYISDIAAWCNIAFYEYASNPLYYVNKLYVNNELVKDIVIPEGVTRIPYYAFSCENIESITIPSSVKSIGRDAFGDNLKNVYINDIAAWCNIDFYEYSSYPLSRANKLYINKELVKDIVIPEGVTSIPPYAFSCENIESITIPSSVTRIELSAFNNCTDLQNIFIDDNNPIYTDVDGVLIDKSKETLIFCPKATKLTSLSIPTSVKIIGDSAFSGCDSLINITIPNSVKRIAPYAFWGCDSIRNVTIPGSVTSIGACAFYRCNNLTSVSLSKNISILEESAFSGLYNLKKIFIPKSLQLIEAYNFDVDDDGNSNLTDIYYEGTEQEWAELNDAFILEGNDGLNNATIHYNSTGLPIAGDIDGTEGVSDRDVVYLLNYTLDSENYPLNQDCDFNGDGVVNDRDVIYLLYHSFLPDKYPLN